MGATKTKVRNRMKTSTLKALAQLKMHYGKGGPKSCVGKLSRSTSTPFPPGPNVAPLESLDEFDIMVAFDNMTNGVDELEALELGQDQDHDMVDHLREDAFMDKLFDFDMLENPEEPVDVTEFAGPGGAEDGWDLEDIALDL